jgi:hypothetical protein
MWWKDIVVHDGVAWVGGCVIMKKKKRNGGSCLLG